MKTITQPARTSLRRIDVNGAIAGAPLVSVIIPTHNRAGLVGRAIESVLRQTFQDFELIVVDDKSRDNTADVVAAVSDARVSLLRLPKNGGVSHARNTGIGRACGEWVGFLDDDDEWLPELLEKQLARLAQSPGASVVYCLRAGLRPDGTIMPSTYKPPLPEGDVSDSIFVTGHTMSPCAHIVKRSALLQVRGFDESFPGAEDRDLWLRLAQAGFQFVAVPETLVTVHEGHKRRLTEDAVAITQGFAAFERRWVTLANRRLGRDVYDAWKLGRYRWLERLQSRHVKRLVRKGRRKEAWRYVRAMTPTVRTLPWVAPHVVRALAVVALGQAAGRLLNVERHAAKAPRALPAGDGADDLA